MDFEPHFLQRSEVVLSLVNIMTGVKATHQLHHLAMCLLLQFVAVALLTLDL